MTRSLLLAAPLSGADCCPRLQANFRFLVSDTVDLRRYAGDADLMLDWDDVLQVTDTA